MGQDVPSETRTFVYSKMVGNPKSWLNFVQFSAFERAWKSLRLSDDELRCLEMAIMLDPKGPPVIRGTGGVRKIRFAPEGVNRGKRGGMRVCYVYFAEYGLVGLLAAYSKTRKSDLTPEQRDAMKGAIERIDRYLSGG